MRGICNPMGLNNSCAGRISTAAQVSSSRSHCDSVSRPKYLRFKHHLKDHSRVGDVVGRQPVQPQFLGDPAVLDMQRGWP